MARQPSRAGWRSRGDRRGGDVVLLHDVHLPLLPRVEPEVPPIRVFQAPVGEVLVGRTKKDVGSKSARGSSLGAPELQFLNPGPFGPLGPSYADLWQSLTQREKRILVDAINLGFAVHSHNPVAVIAAAQKLSKMRARDDCAFADKARSAGPLDRIRPFPPQRLASPTEAAAVAKPATASARSAHVAAAPRI